MSSIIIWLFFFLFSQPNVEHLSKAVSAAPIQNSSQSVKNLEWNRHASKGQFGHTAAYIEN
jgi:hypothetical protein